VDAKLSPSSVPGLQLQHQWPVDGAVYAQVGARVRAPRPAWRRACRCRAVPARLHAWVQAAGRPAPPAHDARRAQPLYAPGVKFADHTYRNLVIIATEFNSVFAFDAGAACVRGLLLCTAAPLHMAPHGCTFAHAARSPRRHARAAVEQVADHRARGHGRRHPRGAQPARRPLHGHRAVLRRGASPPRDAPPPRPLLACLNSQLSAAAVPASWRCTHLWPLSRRPANRQAL